MLEALPHRRVQQVARVDALQHDGKLKVAGRRVGADPGNIPSVRRAYPAVGQCPLPPAMSWRPASSAGSPPIQPASRDASGNSWKSAGYGHDLPNRRTDRTENLNAVPLDTS